MLRTFTSQIGEHPHLASPRALSVSDLSKQESLEVAGIPGLSDIPGFSRTTNRQDTKNVMGAGDYDHASHGQAGSSRNHWTDAALGTLRLHRHSDI
jgi:hypothetical protein